MPRPNEEAGSKRASVAPEEIPGIVSDLRAAFDSDKTLSKGWRLSQLQALDRMMVEGEEELCRAVFEDAHKSAFEVFMQEISMVRGEIYEAIHMLDAWMADEQVGGGLLSAPSQCCVQKDPLGVVLVLGAWNYSLLLTLQPMIGAIAAGNCVIAKPGSYSEKASSAICRLVDKYMDRECVRAVEGNRHITSALLEQRLDKIFFTGSPSVGQVVAEAAAKQLCPVILELGGKSPCIVDKSADVPVAALRTAWGALMNCGQTCVRPDYVMVHASVADEFLRELKGAVLRFYGADPRRTEFFGRIINDAAFRRLSRCVEDGRPFLALGGDSDADERYMAPSVFDFGADWAAFERSELMQDEIFGPLIPVVRFTDLDDQALRFVRARPKPLALYMFSTDAEASERALRLTSSGGAIINDVVMHLSNPELPFGGVGASGMGAYHGERSFKAFSHEKAVMRRGTFLDAPQRYPPHSAFDQTVMRAALHPAVGFHFAHASRLLTDKKNLALGAMAAYIARGFFRSSKL